MKTHHRAAMVAMVVCFAITGFSWYTVKVAARQQTETSEAQTTMRGIFFTLTMVYTSSLDPEAFEDPANHMQIQSGLQALVANSSELEQHGAGLNPSYGYYRRSLARDAQDALARFNKGQYMGSRFVISKMIENCVSCHTKLPSRQEFDLGEEFVSQRSIRKLEPEERVQVEMAMRQFHAAERSYEKLFADPEMTPESLTLLGAFAGYLRLCVGALNDPERAVETLQQYAQRADVTATFKNEVNGWITQLRAVDLEDAKGSELATAKRLIENAESNRKHPSDRSRLADYVVGSALLNRYIEAGPAGDTDASEAFYLMGICEARVSQSYWVSETDFLLEQAIRRAPKSEVARQAFDFLTDYTIAAHAETTARKVSPDLKADLEELRKLIEE